MSKEIRLADAERMRRLLLAAGLIIAAWLLWLGTRRVVLQRPLRHVS